MTSDQERWVETPPLASPTADFGPIRRALLKAEPWLLGAVFLVPQGLGVMRWIAGWR